MSSDAIGEVARRLVYAFVGSAAGSALEAAEEALPRFGRRHPRALRFARLGGGAFLFIGGVYEAVMSLVVFVWVVGTGDRDDILVTPVLLLPLAMGVGLTIWGSRMVRGGWASRRSVDARTPSSDPDPYIPKAAEEGHKRPGAYWRV